MSNIKSLITGGAGFIGSHLVEVLLSMGHNITVLDDMSTGTYNNIEPFNKDKKFSFSADGTSKGANVEADTGKASEKHESPKQQV